MVYLNWGHTITPSKLEAHLRFNWKSSLQHIQWPLHPQRKKSLVSLSLGFSAAPCAGFVALKTVPVSAVLLLWRRSEAVAASELLCLGAHHRMAQPRRITGVSRPKRQFQQSPGRSHCSCVIVRAQGEGKPLVFLMAVVPAVLQEQDSPKPNVSTGFLARAGGRVWLCFALVANNVRWVWLSSLLRMRQTAKEASKWMGVFWSTLERVCFLSPLAQWHMGLDDWFATEPVGKCQWKNAEKEQIFLQMLVTIFLPLVNPNQQEYFFSTNCSKPTIACAKMYAKGEYTQTLIKNTVPVVNVMQSNCI